MVQSLDLLISVKYSSWKELNGESYLQSSGGSVNSRAVESLTGVLKPWSLEPCQFFSGELEFHWTPD